MKQNNIYNDKIIIICYDIKKEVRTYTNLKGKGGGLTMTKKEDSPKQVAFTNKTVTKLFNNISARQLDYWVRTGLMKPSILTSGGRGSSRVYSFVDLIQISTINALLEGGMSIQQIRKSAKYLNEELGEEMPLTARLLLYGKTIVKIVKDDDEFLKAIDTLTHQGQVVFMLSIGKLKREVEEKVKKLEKAA